MPSPTPSSAVPATQDAQPVAEGTALWPESASSTTRRPSSQDEPPHDAIAAGELDKKPTRGPFWLTKTALTAFLLLFVACAASLVILNGRIAALDGLPLAISSSSYSWTYGPTAILVIILSFWRHVDYQYKSSQPWRELWARPAPAARSLLLDYITPFQGTIMIRAMKNGHQSVPATVLYFFLLKLIILVSTTLFVVIPTQHVESFRIQYQDKLDAADAWTSLGYDPIMYDYTSPGPRDTSAFQGGSDTAVWTYLAKISNGTRNDTGWNPENNWATQSFAPTSAGANTVSLEAPVDIFTRALVSKTLRLKNKVPAPLQTP